MTAQTGLGSLRSAQRALVLDVCDGDYSAALRWLPGDMALRHDFDLVDSERHAWQDLWRNTDADYDPMEWRPRYRSRRLDAPTVRASGRPRSVWLVDGVVYKIGSRSVSEYEHSALGRWREVGAHWAPATALWKVEDPMSKTVACVLAMTHLPDEGGSHIDDLAQIIAAAPQSGPQHWHTTSGRTYLIDGDKIDHFP
ncbi:hypothetical protein [Nocardia carnea]|uniref:hypothetical protein n=1 Tax=Nocardia carnea TaxID=37328 RepID=UPI002458A2F6|nr:hypothetical protein [Nocardia carnea]